MVVLLLQEPDYEISTRLYHPEQSCFSAIANMQQPKEEDINGQR